MRVCDAFKSPLLKLGARVKVRYKPELDDEHVEFTGEVIHLWERTIDVKRDDGVPGAGEDGSWFIGNRSIAEIEFLPPSIGPMKVFEAFEKGLIEKGMRMRIHRTVNIGDSYEECEEKFSGIVTGVDEHVFYVLRDDGKVGRGTDPYWIIGGKSEGIIELFPTENKAKELLSNSHKGGRMRVREAFEKGLLTVGKRMRVFTVNPYSGVISGVGEKGISLKRDDKKEGGGYSGDWLISSLSEVECEVLTGVENYRQVVDKKLNEISLDEACEKRRVSSVFMAISNKPKEDGVAPWVFSQNGACKYGAISMNGLIRFGQSQLKESLSSAISNGWKVYYFDDEVEAMSFIATLYNQIITQ